MLPSILAIESSTGEQMELDKLCMYEVSAKVICNRLNQAALEGDKFAAQFRSRSKKYCKKHDDIKKAREKFMHKHSLGQCQDALITMGENVVGPRDALEIIEDIRKGSLIGSLKDKLHL